MGKEIKILTQLIVKIDICYWNFTNICKGFDKSAWYSTHPNIVENRYS